MFGHLFLALLMKHCYPSKRKWHNRGCVILQTFCQMMCWICRRMFLEHSGKLWCQPEVRWHNRGCVILHDMEEVTLYCCSPYPPRLPGEFLWDMGRYYQVKCWKIGFLLPGHYFGPYNHLGGLLGLGSFVRVYCTGFEGLYEYLVGRWRVRSPNGCSCVHALYLTVCPARDYSGCTALSNCSH